MRVFIAFMAGGAMMSVINSPLVFFLTMALTWVTLQIISPGWCPHCRKGVRLFAGTCHHCGKEVRAG
jgi:hypothetical protein